VRADRAPLEEALGELYRVCGGALAQVVGHDPHVECLLVAGVPADATHEHVVAAGGVDRHRIQAGGRVVKDGDAGRGPQQLPGPLRCQRVRVCTLTASECPFTTGTRTQVALIRIDGRRDLAVS